MIIESEVGGQSDERTVCQMFFLALRRDLPQNSKVTCREEARQGTEVIVEAVLYS